MLDFGRLLNFIKKTNQPCLIVSEKEGKVFVVMNWSEFEKLKNFQKPVESLSEEELLSKINKEIALWRLAQEKEKEEELEFSLKEKRQSEETEGEEQFYFEPLE